MEGFAALYIFMLAAFTGYEVSLESSGKLLLVGAGPGSGFPATGSVRLNTVAGPGRAQELHGELGALWKKRLSPRKK